MHRDVVVTLSIIQKFFQSNTHMSRQKRHRHRHRKKTCAGDSLFARLNNTTTMPTLMKILL